MIEAIAKRASVRRFADDPVTDEEVRAMLRAGMAAPSGGNQQPWEFYVVRDRETLDRLAEVTPYSKPAASAPCAIVPCMRTQGLRFPELAVQDVSAAVENILLEAVELGLGAVWMGIAPGVEDMAAVSAIVGAPADLEPFAIIACGRPAVESAPKGAERYDEGRVHWLS